MAADTSTLAGLQVLVRQLQTKVPLEGDVDPEGNVVGEYLNQLYRRRGAVGLFVFEGTPGQNTGWRQL